MIVNYIYGLGGRDIGPEELASIYESLQKGKVKSLVNYIGVRE